MSPSLDRGEAADAADGQADDSYQKSATGVLQHGDGEVSTFGLAAGWLSVDEAEAGPRHLGDATHASDQIVALLPWAEIGISDAMRRPAALETATMRDRRALPDGVVVGSPDRYR